MSMNYFKKLPEPEVLKEEFPMTPELTAIKSERDREIRKVFTGESDKFLVIIGPCSADREDAVLEYVERLARVNEKTKDKLIIIPRVYTNNQEPQVKVIRVCFISLTLTKSLTFMQELHLSENFI